MRTRAPRLQAGEAELVAVLERLRSELRPIEFLQLVERIEKRLQAEHDDAQRVRRRVASW